MTPAIVRWGRAMAWFADARDADALAGVLRRGPDTVTVTPAKWGPDDFDRMEAAAETAEERCEELKEAIGLAAEKLDVGDADISQTAAREALAILRQA